MASESSDERAVSVRLPQELDDWLGEKATALGVDEGTVLVQLLSSYRAAEELDDEALDPAALFDDTAEVDTEAVEPAVREVVRERLPAIASAVEDEMDERDDVAAVEDRLIGELDRLERDLDDAESTFQEKLENVRERVIQVKKETDAKAPADHDHAEFDELSRLETRVDELAAAADDRDDRLADVESELAEVTDLAERLDELEERLNTVAWVVSDLRDTVEATESGTRAIDRLKRSAAQEDVDRAVCDNCEQPVDIALLSEPKCPHCQATVSDVKLPGGFFGKPRLTVAKQLESGDDEDDSNVPDAARR